MNAVDTVSTAAIGSSPAFLSRITSPRASSPSANRSSGRGSARERKPVADLLVRVRGSVLDKRLLLRRRRRQADQVEVNPPQKGQLVGGTDGLQALVLVLLRDKGVDRIGRGSDAGGNLGTRDGLERPEVAL